MFSGTLATIVTITPATPTTAPATSQALPGARQCITAITPTTIARIAAPR